MAISIPPGEDQQLLYGNFAFHLQFVPNEAGFAPGRGLSDEILGAFSDVSGLEATIETSRKIKKGHGGAPSPQVITLLLVI